MWTCPKCERIFAKSGQPHSCRKIPLDYHFKNRQKAENLFNYLFEIINHNIGKCKIISLPCCIHLFGTYDFLAALPKKESIEIRFALNRKLDCQRLKASVPLSSRLVKNCFEIRNPQDYDQEFMTWVKESYHLKD